MNRWFEYGRCQDLRPPTERRASGVEIPTGSSCDSMAVPVFGNFASSLKTMALRYEAVLPDKSVKEKSCRDVSIIVRHRFTQPLQRLRMIASPVATQSLSHKRASALGTNRGSNGRFRSWARATRRWLSRPELETGASNTRTERSGWRQAKASRSSEMAESVLSIRR